MAADRPVHTDALHTLGMIITDAEKRDAIHLAVEPVVAGEDLNPGDDVGIGPDGRAGRDAAEPVGIVDPFLKAPVGRGERFWLIVYPRQITSLRHVWEHPAFPALSPTSAELSSRDASRAWMQAWAVEHMSEDYYGDDDGKLSAEAAYGLAIDAGRTHRLGPHESAREYIDSEWWGHWEAITGQRGDRDAYFSCAC